MEGIRGRSAIVTGAGSGIGREIALLFASEGAKVVVAELNEAAGRETERMIRDSGGEAIFLRTDVSLDGDCASAVRLARESFGSVDVLINNAGIDGRPAPVADIDPADLDRIMRVNFTGAFLMCRHALREMAGQRRGSIVNIASLGGLIPVHNGMPYSASKAALIMLTRSIAAEYGRYGVRANAIAPGWAETDMVRRYAEQSSIDPQEFRRAVSRRAPLGRLATTRDVADLALFLCSDRASYITGQTYVIDGGLSVT